MKQIAKYFKYLFLLSFLIFLACSEDPIGPKLIEGNWPISSPELQGMDSHLLSQAFVQGEDRGYVDCILVIKNGYLVAERYYNGYEKEIAHNVKSVSKSFLSALTGIALREGYISSLSLKMLDFFPEYVNPSINKRKHKITIRHLLMMRSGIDDERNNYNQIYSSSNWIKTTIDFPLMYEPGSTFSYNTFQTHLLSAIITKASEMSTLEFARRYLFEPMNIDVDEWQQGPQGYYFGGNNMYFTPRDMAMLGHLYMNNGSLNGLQIVPQDWIEESLTNYTQFTGYNWGDLKNINYGYLWWLGEIRNHEVFLAVGYGGQFVISFKDMNLIVVTTADNQVSWTTSDQQIGSILNIVADYIVPAVRR